MFGKASAVALLLLAFASGAAAVADTFGTGPNQFTLDFVPISGATNPTSGYGIVNRDYRMGVGEITNDQWNKFQSAYGAVNGSPSSAYDASFNPWGIGTVGAPANNVSWYEAAQFVNWLNVSTNHQAAYKFTGTQGTGNYAFAPWTAAEAAGGTNLYRHKDAYYFLPTEDEWSKAAYWNGVSRQTFATKLGENLTQGSGVGGSGWNYMIGTDAGPSGAAVGPWNVGSGSQELNGTRDMMGNVWEWMESPYSSGDYGVTALRGARGGASGSDSSSLAYSNRGYNFPENEDRTIGFRVASNVPEPGCIALLAGLALTALLCCWRKRPYSSRSA
jgi:formylglycine-generating enzyme required for sulfatase activity